MKTLLDVHTHTIASGHAYSEIIDLAAKESGLSPDFIKSTEQNLSSGWLYTLLLGSGYSTPGTGTGRIGLGPQSLNVPLADQVFNAQRNTIIDLAKKGPCIPGRSENRQMVLSPPYLQ